MSTKPYHDIPSRSYNMTCHVRHAISYAMPCLSGRTRYHAMHCQAMSYTILCLPDHVIYHIMPARPYHIAFHAHQAIPLTMPDRPYHIPCHVHNAIPYTIPCTPGHAIHHARQAIPYTMPCIARSCHIPCYASPDHTLYHVMATRPYHMPCPPVHTIYHAMPTRPYHMPCQPGHAIYNVPCHTAPGHNINHAMPPMPYHIPYHAHQVIPYTMYICISRNYGGQFQGNHTEGVTWFLARCCFIFKHLLHFSLNPPLFYFFFFNFSITVYHIRGVIEKFVSFSDTEKSTDFK